VRWHAVECLRHVYGMLWNGQRLANTCRAVSPNPNAVTYDSNCIEPDYNTAKWKSASECMMLKPPNYSLFLKHIAVIRERITKLPKPRKIEQFLALTDAETISRTISQKQWTWEAAKKFAGDLYTTISANLEHIRVVPFGLAYNSLLRKMLAADADPSAQSKALCDAMQLIDEYTAVITIDSANSKIGTIRSLVVDHGPGMETTYMARSLTASGGKAPLTQAWITNTVLNAIQRTPLAPELTQPNALAVALPSTVKYIHRLAFCDLIVREPAVNSLTLPELVTHDLPRFFAWGAALRATEFAVNVALELAYRKAHGVVDSLGLFFADLPSKHYFSPAEFVDAFTMTLAEDDRAVVKGLVEHIARPNNPVAKITRTRLSKFVLSVLELAPAPPPPAAYDVDKDRPPHGFPAFVDPIIKRVFEIVAPANRLAHLNLSIHSALFTSIVETALQLPEVKSLAHAHGSAALPFDE
jgi:hypothetical protein